MSRSPLRLVLLLLCASIFAFIGLGWVGVHNLNARLERFFEDFGRARPPLSLEDLNAPPAVDPLCLERLAALEGTKFRPARGFERGRGCVVENAINLDRVAGLRVRPGGALMRCEVAEQLHHWLAEAVIPTAEEVLEASPTAVGHLGTYNCRTIGGNSAVLSQHSFANAVDVAWFDFEDGTRHRLVDGWDHEREDISEFWQKVQQLSCKYFDVSLGPDYNSAHADHFHFDLGPLTTCR